MSATLSVQEDVKYRIHNGEAIRYNNKREKILCSQFQWLDNFVLYLPLFIRILPSRQQRSKRCTIFISVFAFVLFLILLPCAIYYVFIYVNARFVVDSSMKIYIIFGYIITTFTQFIDRGFSLIYYFYYFNYPWYSKHKYNNTNNDIQNNWIINNYSIILKILTFTYILAYLGNAFLGANVEKSIQEINEAVYIISLLVDVILIETPNFLTLIIHCVICYKYHWFLKQLMAEIRNNTNLNRVSMEYKVISDTFKVDYNFFLRWCVIIYATDWLLMLWSGSLNPYYHRSVHDWTITQDFVEIFAFILILILITLYVVSSSLLSETFYSFETLLWEYKKQCIGNDQELNNLSILTSLIGYCNKYPMYISFGGLVMTKKNIAVFAITFIGIRIAAQLLVVTLSQPIS